MNKAKRVELATIDLDGTLLSHEKTISNEAIQLIQEKIASGRLITIATGRSYESAETYIKQLGLELPVITSNGARISNENKVYLSLAIPLDKLRNLIEESDEKGLSVVYTIDGKEFSYNNTPWLIKERREKNLYTREHKIQENEWSDLSVEKLMIWNDEPNDSVSKVSRTITELGDGINAVKYFERCYEITHPQASKANSVHFLADKLGIHMDQVMHIGDDMNDIELLELAGLGIAPANSLKEAAEAADYCSKYDRTSAVIEALTKYL